MRILLVDDSILVRGMMKALLESLGYDVVGEEANGRAAVSAAAGLRPDLIIMDVNMPEMDGITATGIIMKETPVPIIVFTSEDVADVGYRAVNEGAVEVIPKPDISEMNDIAFRSRIREILEAVASAGAGRRSHQELFSELRRTEVPCARRYDTEIIVVGASTGGPSAVRTLISALPADFPVPLILTQHIQQGFDAGYADWLDDSAKLCVRLAKPQDKPAAGVVIVAPATHHLVCSRGALCWDDGPRLDNQKPSVDKMFISAADAYGPGVTGVLLTGMGRDGANGCRQIIDRGGDTIVQDAQTSIIFGMPKAAIELGAASEVLALEHIAGELIRRQG